MKLQLKGNHLTAEDEMWKDPTRNALEDVYN